MSGLLNLFNMLQKERIEHPNCGNGHMFLGAAVVNNDGSCVLFGWKESLSDQS